MFIKTTTTRLTFSTSKKMLDIVMIILRAELTINFQMLLSFESYLNIDAMKFMVAHGTQIDIISDASRVNTRESGPM